MIGSQEIRVMKALAVFFAVTTFGLGAVCVLQHLKLTEVQNELAGARTEAAQLADQIKEAEVRQTQAEQQIGELTTQAEDLAAKLASKTISESNLVAKADAALAAKNQPPPPETPKPNK